MSVSKLIILKFIALNNNLKIKTKQLMSSQNINKNLLGFNNKWLKTVP
jgi:hypothetical protein